MLFSKVIGWPTVPNDAFLPRFLARGWVPSAVFSWPVFSLFPSPDLPSFHCSPFPRPSLGTSSLSLYLAGLSFSPLSPLAPVAVSGFPHAGLCSRKVLTAFLQVHLRVATVAFSFVTLYLCTFVGSSVGIPSPCLRYSP